VVSAGERCDCYVEIDAVGNSYIDFCGGGDSDVYDPRANRKSPASATKDARRNTVGPQLSAPTTAAAWIRRRALTAMSVATAHPSIHQDAGLIDTGMAKRVSMVEKDRRNSSLAHRLTTLDKRSTHSHGVRGAI
jgi:hypothetical protein